MPTIGKFRLCACELSQSNRRTFVTKRPPAIKSILNPRLRICPLVIVVSGALIQLTAWIQHPNRCAIGPHAGTIFYSFILVEHSGTEAGQYGSHGSFVPPDFDEMQGTGVPAQVSNVHEYATHFQIRPQRLQRTHETPRSKCHPHKASRFPTTLCRTKPHSAGSSFSSGVQPDDLPGLAATVSNHRLRQQIFLS